jgi:hypothetical protein
MLRLVLLLLAIRILTLPAQADEAASPHQRVTWEAHFAQANLAHDGHLTLEEAKSGYKTIARHFRDIDADGKGYVTENDVRAWHAQQRAARHPAEDPLRPRPAFQRMPPEQREQTMQTRSTLVITPDIDRRPEGDRTGQ